MRNEENICHIVQHCLFYTALTTFENLSGQEMGCWSDVFIVNFEHVDIGWGETTK